MTVVTKSKAGMCMWSCSAAAFFSSVNKGAAMCEQASPRPAIQVQ